jgi:hypothetical protein
MTPPGRTIFVHVVGGADLAPEIVAFVHRVGDLLAVGRVGRMEFIRVGGVGNLALTSPTGVDRVDLGVVCA